MASPLQILARDPGGRARAGLLRTAHGEVRTPAFVPLATKATVKGLTPIEVRDLGYDMVLGNTYHLFLDPGHELIAGLGGLHEFMRWDQSIITDSGGFQVFSMGHGTVADEIKGRASHGGERHGKTLGITEEGVRFRSHIDGSDKFLAPETSMEIQAALGSDIALVFDECTPFNVTKDYTARSTERTHRWLERCLTWHDALVPEPDRRWRVDLTAGRFKDSDEPIYDGCPCPTCAAGNTRGYLRYLVKNRELTGLRLLVVHNLAFVRRVMTGLRDAIIAGTL